MRELCIRALGGRSEGVLRDRHIDREEVAEVDNGKVQSSEDCG